MDPDILQALDKGASVITSTRRLAYELTEAYSRHQISKGKTVWPTVQINTWDGQMQAYWRAYSAHRAQICLNPLQLQSLLAQIIKTDIEQYQAHNASASAALWNYTASAKMAQDAWQICHQWQISFSSLRDTEHVDHASFGRWATSLYAHLRQSNWITSAQIEDILVAENWPIDPEIVLLGFDRLNKQQQQFIAHYSANGARILQSNHQPRPSEAIRVTSFDSTRAQWQQVGAWAREKLLDKPNIKLGIITPNIENIRFIARQCLREQLSPQSIEQTTSEPFHFSQGQTLSSVPIVDSALACLALLGMMEFKQFTPIFLSNYWGSEAEQSLRAQFIHSIRKHIAYQFDLFQLLQAFPQLSPERQKNEICQQLHSKLSQLQTLKSEHRKARSIATWRALFDQCLELLGWPNSNLNSTEFQAQQAWNKCLDDWVTLDTICPPMSLGQALASLKQHCQQTQFQAQANVNAPVQIMGILETAELEFDAVWLADFDEQAWPVVANANPFIPLNLQIMAGVPEASIKVQTEQAMLKTGQLLSLCDDIQLSYAHSHNDIGLKLSPLITKTAELSEYSPVIPFVLYDAIRAATPEPILIHDDLGTALCAETARGGTGVISQQSACPFSAYAKYRLNAGTEEDPEPGLNRLERGSLMHEILATIWAELETSSALRTRLEEKTLDALVSHHTQQSVTRHAKHCGLGEGFIQTEATRLRELITQWLMLETRRPAFKVDATEQAYEYEINGLRLNFKLDRVDLLTSNPDDHPDDTSRLILDYKSKKCNLKDWANERPEEPQIPLYYLALTEENYSAPVSCLSYAQVKQGESQFVGISQHDVAIDGISALETLGKQTSFKKEFNEWSELKSLWKTRIGDLATDYRSGVANVDPKSASSCTYCDFSSLCRISTRINLQSDDDAT